jgi:hypothetical protein
MAGRAGEGRHVNNFKSNSKRVKRNSKKRDGNSIIKKSERCKKNLINPDLSRTRRTIHGGTAVRSQSMPPRSSAHIHQINLLATASQRDGGVGFPIRLSGCLCVVLGITSVYERQTGSEAI